MLYRQFKQGLTVTLCASISFMTLGYIFIDIHKMEKRQLQNDYENKIRVLYDEINKLKLEKDVIKINCIE